MTGAAKNLLDALTAIAAGYNVSVRDDRYICVENPEYRPDCGNNPSIVIDVEEVRKFLGSSDRAMVSSNPFAPTPAVPEGWRDALEHVTELLVDTWHHQMDGDPEEQIAVKDARALLATLPLSVPEGWVLVPKEPTPEMLDAATPPESEWIGHKWAKPGSIERWRQGHREEAERKYRSMISAAPAAPTGWQLAETAPDDTEVFAWSPKYGGIYLAIKQDGEWRVPDLHPSNWEPIDAPTHWMPLPAAPTEASDE